MRRLVLAAVVTLCVACGGDNAVGPEAITGTYTLRSVNGATLPATYYQDKFEKDEFFDGSIVLAADHSWTGSFSVRATDLTSGALMFSAPLPVSGTYSLNQGSVTLTDAAHSLTMTGTVGGGKLALGAELGDVTTPAFVFTK